LATLTPHSSVNLFDYATSDGRSLKKALDFLVPFALLEEEWPYEQIDHMPREVFFQQFRMAANVWQNAQYEKDILRLPEIDYYGEFFINLLFPRQYHLLDLIKRLYT